MMIRRSCRRLAAARAAQPARRMGSSTPVLPPATGTMHLYGWGANRHNLLMGSAGGKQTPMTEPIEADLAAEVVDVDGDPILQMSVGEKHAGFVTASGELYTVGEGKYGKLGHGSEKDVTGYPKRVDGIDGRVVQFAAGYYHSAALTEDGEVYTWGWGGSFMNGVGALGHGTRADVNRPKLVKGLADEPVRQIEASQYHMLALTRNGDVFSWGRGEGGRLGVSSTTDKKSPVHLDMLAGQRVIKVSAGRSFNAAVTDRGRVYSWGRNNASQLGQPADFNMDVLSVEKTPVLVESLAEDRVFIRDLVCGSRHVVALDADGDVWFWGESKWPLAKRLTDHMNEESGMAADTFNRQRFVSVAAGHKFSAAVDADGRIWTWGVNKDGSLGLGHAKKKVEEPCNVDGFETGEKRGRAVTVACGKGATLALSRHARQ